MPSIRVARLLAPLIGLACAGPVYAQNDDPLAPQTEVSPSVFLRYRELTNRESFNFVLANQKYTRPVGDLTMEFPLGAVPSSGLDPVARTFCVEPLVPMYAGDVYPFTVDALGKPSAFGLPDNPDGVAAAEKRARYIRELYGRYYVDVATDPKVNAPAFQAALWELSQETEVPDGPMPFSLYTGTFQADYPAQADAPAFVQRAQQYVQDLTGDDSVFAANPALSNLTLSRLTALQPVGGAMVGQSQLALTTTAPISTGSDAGGLGGPALGTLGGIPTGFGGSPLRSTGGGLGGPASGGFPGGGGIGGMGGFGGVGTTAPNTGNSSGPGTSGPVTPGGSVVIPTIPSAPGTDTGTSTGGPSTGLPQNPPGVIPPLTPVSPIPAPAGVVLGVVGLGVFAGRRYLSRVG